MLPYRQPVHDGGLLTLSIAKSFTGTKPIALYEPVAYGRFVDEGELEEFLVALRNVAEAHDELEALSANRQDVYEALFREGCGLRTGFGELH